MYITGVNFGSVAPVAQRIAVDFGSTGPEFKSLRARQGVVSLPSKPPPLPFPLGDHVFDEVADGEGALIIHRFVGHAL